jgi:hypothetical protein
MPEVLHYEATHEILDEDRLQHTQAFCIIIIIIIIMD